MGLAEWILGLVLSWIDKIWNALKGLVKAAIKAAIDAVAWTIYNTYKTIKNVYNTVNEFIYNTYNIVNKYVTNVTKIITSWVADTWANITKFTNWITVNIWSWLNSTWKTASDFWDSVTSKINEWWETATDLTVKFVVGAAIGAKNWVDDLGKKWGDFVDGVGAEWDKVTAAITLGSTKVWNELTEAATDPTGYISLRIGENTRHMLDKFAEGFGEPPGEVEERFKEGEKPNWEEVDTSNMKW